jgi:hypothetical protein
MLAMSSRITVTLTGPQADVIMEALDAYQQELLDNNQGGKANVAGNASNAIIRASHKRSDVDR